MAFPQVVTKRYDGERVMTCVCLLCSCVFIKLLHIHAHSGPVILVILCHLHGVRYDVVGAHQLEPHHDACRARGKTQAKPHLFLPSVLYKNNELFIVMNLLPCIA